MAPGMMTKRFSALILIMLLCGGGLLFPLFCEDGKWVIAAQKFTPDAGQVEDAVNSKTAEMLPSDILEKIGYSVVRNVMPDEQFERQNYKLRTERQSLFLQLSAEYKKRDSLVLSNYSDYKLKSAVKDSQKKIKEIQKKIDANLAELKKATEDMERKMADVAAGKANSDTDVSELEKYKQLVRNIFVKDDSLIQQEQITFYRDDFTSLYTDAIYEKNVVSAGINSLITGHFSKYGEYISVYVDLYTYPGEKHVASVAEVGSVSELELVTNSIALQLIPALSNSLPVQLQIVIQPEEAASKTAMYIDDALQKDDDGIFTFDSGIHTIQFVCEGYKTAGTTYAFEGNRTYKIEVNLEQPKSGFLQVGLRNSLEGDILMNGERALEIDGKKSQIAINGKQILGEFVTEDGETAFFYIPQKLTFDGSYVTIKPKPMDRMAYIDKRRKIMYTSYSIFVLSLIPTFYAYGNYQNQINLYKNYQVDYETARKWQTATNTTRLISIGAGVFWGYELVRYLIAANSVLPQNARAGDPSEFEYVDPETLKETNEKEIENKNDEEKE